MNIIVLSIPLYFIFIGIEAFVGWRRGQRIFRAADVANNLMLGLAQTVFSALVAGLIVGSYALLHEHRLFDISVESIWAWGILFLAQDFLYYWFHRVSHRMNLVWIGHGPHHQSEDFNFSVALRQGPIQPLFSNVFYLPLALFGFPPAMFATVAGINTVYQFFLHTELVRTLGPLEWILNTPSHHRVHHGCNGRYLDKNYGAILIIWDRMFGSFEPERQTPVYGTVKPIATFDPLHSSWAPFRDLGKLIKAAPTWRDKLIAWAMPPEWRPRGLPPAEMDVVPDRPKHHVRVTRRAFAYFVVGFTLLVGVSSLLLFHGAHASVTAKLVFAAWFVLALGGLGAVIEGRASAKWMEMVRVATTPLVIYLLLKT